MTLEQAETLKRLYDRMEAPALTFAEFFASAREDTLMGCVMVVSIG